jgi:hypothetical protein
MIAFIVIVLLIVIACAVAPDLMGLLFRLALFIAGCAIALAVAGGLIALVVNA